MDVLAYLATVITLGIAAQWVAWRLHLPAILLLLVFGALLVPGWELLSGADLNAEDVIGTEILFPIVSLSVAVILFEGGLSLRISELRGTGHMVIRLVTLGVLITWVLATWAAWVLFDFNLAIAALLGAILTVSGPTVVGPLLRHVRPQSHIGSLAKWEGIINDPVGVVLAVLVFEAITIGAFGEAALATALALIKTVALGAALGLVASFVLVLLLKRFLIPDYLQSAAFLAVVVASFAVSNAIQPESGLVTVTVLGIVLANQRFVDIRHVIEFKENLRVLLISTLFILLASRLELSDIRELGWRGIAFVAALLAIRPVAVFISALGTGLKPRTLIFLSWLHPRGIVAAAVSSLFVLELIHGAGHQHGSASMAQLAAQAEQIVPITFLVIVSTVTIYGLTLSPLAHWIGAAQPNRQGILFAGAESFIRAIAQSLHAEGCPVLLVDTNRHNIAAARMAGLKTCQASILSEHVQEELDLSDIGRLLAMTPNDDVNSLAAMELTDVFGRDSVYQLTPETPRGPR